jgi:predicted MFS family arabinose efflux permease
MQGMEEVIPTIPTTLPHKPKSRLPRAVQLLQSPRLLAALWGTLVHAAILTAIDTTLPLFVKQTFGFNSLGAGLMFLPYVIPAFFGPIIGAGSDKYGAKWFATGGFLVSIPFLACFKFVHDNTIGHKVLLCALLFGVGTSQALAYGPLMAEIMWTIEAEGEQRFGKGYADSQGVYAQAYGLFNVAWSSGAILGPIMGGFIRDAADWGAVGWSLAALAAFTAVLQGIWVGGVFWGSGRKVEVKEKEGTNVNEGIVELDDKSRERVDIARRDV